jgi:hypothetical protein
MSYWLTPSMSRQYSPSGRPKAVGISIWLQAVKLVTPSVTVAW